MKLLKRRFFISIRYYIEILKRTSDATELCITRDCIEDIAKIMWSHYVITYNTLKNIRALAGAIMNKRIVD